MCNQNVTESETHFLFHCSKYDGLRQEFFDCITNVYPNFHALSEGDKFMTLMLEPIVKKTAQFVWQCFDLRRCSMYTNT